jgi:phosphate starvation-inducible PhoH-like protein
LGEDPQPDKMIEQVIVLGQQEVLEFCGRNDHHLREIEQRTDTRIVPRGNELKIRGASAPVRHTISLIKELLDIMRSSGRRLDKRLIQFALNSAGSGEAVGESPEASSMRSIFLDTIPVPLKRRTLTPLTPGQKAYVEAIRNHDIVFGIGPAGTGKTYLACAMAVSHLTQGHVRRIILVRPAVEAGEKLGFLPGDLEAKINPYLRPLYDALYEMMEVQRIQDYLKSGVIEVAPLAFMRGRTLNNAFVILDEAQNTRSEQMKMFLTRLGFDSKAVITGDITQIDLEKPAESGLIEVRRILDNIEGIEFCYFDERDVVRHELVQMIIKAYEQQDHRKNGPVTNAPEAEK